MSDITIDRLVSAIDAITPMLADVPGRTPQDRQAGAILLELAECTILSSDDQGEITMITSSFLRPDEAAAMAKALAGLALRLGAYLGRDAT